MEDSAQDLTVREVAQLAGVTEQAVRKALGEGRLRGSRLRGLGWSVPAPEAKAWAQHVRTRARRSEGPVPLLSPEIRPSRGALLDRVQELEEQLSQAAAERDTYRDLLEALVHRVSERSLQAVEEIA